MRLIFEPLLLPLQEDNIRLQGYVSMSSLYPKGIHRFKLLISSFLSPFKKEKYSH